MLANESAAANTRGASTPATVAGGACARPVTRSARYPHAIPIAWPYIVWRGEEVGEVGEKKNRKAIGPSEGNTNGLLVSQASTARIEIVTKPFTNTKSAHIGRSGRLERRCVSCSRAMRLRVTCGSSRSSGFRSSGFESAIVRRREGSHAPPRAPAR